MHCERSPDSVQIVPDNRVCLNSQKRPEYQLHPLPTATTPGHGLGKLQGWRFYKLLGKLLQFCTSLIIFFFLYMSRLKFPSTASGHSCMLLMEKASSHSSQLLSVLLLELIRFLLLVCRNVCVWLEMFKLCIYIYTQKMEKKNHKVETNKQTKKLHGTERS